MKVASLFPLLPVLFASGLMGEGPESAPTRDPAWSAYRKGDYETALAHYRKLAQEIEHLPSRELLNFTEVLAEVGCYTEAIQVCQAFLEKHPGDVMAHARLGNILWQTGKYKEAEAAFRTALETSPNSLLAKYGLALVLRVTGRPKDAQAVLEELVEAYYAQPPADPEVILHYGFVFEEVARPHQALNLFVNAAKGMPDPTRARLAAGFLFLSKGQVNDAANEFRPVLEENPKNPDARVGMAGCHFHDGNFPKVTSECEAALQTNPASVEALELLAALSTFEEDYAAALDYLRKALEINPNHLSARIRLASCHYLASDLQAYEKERENIFSIYPSYFEFHRRMGDAAERMRRPEIARKFFEESYSLAPDSWEVLESLGFFYCREGREKEAYEILEKSFKINRFNRRVYNLLQTLDYMDEFLTEESEHFILKVHRKKDACLTWYGFQYLHQAKEAFCKQYEFPIQEKILVELFPRHDYFAARVHGLPGIGLNGVCFGKVIVADSPRIRPGALNWRDVLVHEFSHVVTLHATDYLIPRWLTEGLAVYDEGRPPSFEQDQILVTAWKKGELIPLAKLNRAFTRPQSHTQIFLAYIQSRIAVEYLVTTFKHPKILQVLRALREGKDLPDAVQNGLGVPWNELSETLMAHTAGLAARLPLLPQYGPADLPTLEKAAQEKPQDGNARAEYSLGLLQSNRSPQAEVEAQEAFKLDPALALPHVILAEIAFQKKSFEDAKARYLKALELEPQRLGPQFRLAAIAQEEKRPKDGIEHLMKVLERYDRFPQAYQLLASLAEAAEQTKTRLEALEGMLRFPETLGQATESLLKVYAAVDRHADVERVALALFETNPYVIEAHETLARSYEAQKKLEAAAREYVVCIQLQPTDIDYHLRLAKVFIANQQMPEAKRVLLEAQKVDRANREVKELLDSLP